MPDRGSDTRRWRIQVPGGAEIGSRLAGKKIVPGAFSGVIGRMPSAVQEPCLSVAVALVAHPDSTMDVGDASWAGVGVGGGGEVGRVSRPAVPPGGLAQCLVRTGTGCGLLPASTRSLIHSTRHRLIVLGLDGQRWRVCGLAASCCPMPPPLFPIGKPTCRTCCGNFILRFRNNQHSYPSYLDLTCGGHHRRDQHEGSCTWGH